MKKIYLFSIIALIAILFSSCGSDEFTIKNGSTTIDGCLNGYLEVVDGSYKTSTINDKLSIMVKLKAVQSFELDENLELFLFLEFLDESGMPCPKVARLVTQDEYKVIDALKKGSGEFGLEFVYYKPFASNYCNDMEAFEIISKDAKSFSITSETEERVVYDNSSSSSYSDDEDEDEDEVVAEESSDENWDEVLADYESYTDQYIKLLKKATSGDMSAMTEYASMMEKAQSLQEKLSDAGTMTPAQLQKFTKIQQKLMNAASGL